MVNEPTEPRNDSEILVAIDIQPGPITASQKSAWSRLMKKLLVEVKTDEQ